MEVALQRSAGYSQQTAAEEIHLKQSLRTLERVRQALSAPP
jgi:hypothetical protein